MRNFTRILRVILACCLVGSIPWLVGCEGDTGPQGVQGPPGEGGDGGFDLTKLNAVQVPVGPIVDGRDDDLWSTVPTLTVVVGETRDVYDPSSITDCAGCHAYNSNVQISLKAVHTDVEIFFKAKWNDHTASLTRGGAWEFVGGAWSRGENSEQSEDRLAFYFPIGSPTGAPYATEGCMTKCHMYWPTDTDPHVSIHGIVDDAWLESGRGDMWHSKGARCSPVLSAWGTGLVVDEETHEVTAGMLSTIGYADDKYVDIWQDDSINGEDGGRYGDAGTSTYSHNRIGDKSRPKFMETDPTDYADAMVLLQSEIDNGETVGDATTGVSDVDAADYWPAYTALKAIVPERILRMPAGSRGDIKFGAVWSNGIWTAEFARALNTGNDDDVQFNTALEYLFNVAAFENSRHGYEHRTSGNYMLMFH